MAKFRYYIVSTFDGSVKGSNDEEFAKGMAESQDDFVIDSDTGKWLMVGEDGLEEVDIVGRA